jgi:hypothetical protein
MDILGGQYGIGRVLTNQHIKHNRPFHQIQELRLQGMHHAHSSQLEQPLNRLLDSHEMFVRLVEVEMLCRSQEKTAY